MSSTEVGTSSTEMSSSACWYEFLAAVPPDHLKCPLCSGVATDNACGVIFCKRCIRNHDQETCPSCEEENPTFCRDLKGEFTE